MSEEGSTGSHSSQTNSNSNSWTRECSVSTQGSTNAFMLSKRSTPRGSGNKRQPSHSNTSTCKRQRSHYTKAKEAELSNDDDYDDELGKELKLKGPISHGNKRQPSHSNSSSFNRQRSHYTKAKEAELSNGTHRDSKEDEIQKEICFLSAWYGCTDDELGHHNFPGED